MSIVERSKGRRKHNAKCLGCGKRHGDGAPWWNQGKMAWSITVANAKGGTSSRVLAKADPHLGHRDRIAHDKAMEMWAAGQVPGISAAAGQDAPPTEVGEAMTVEQICDLYQGYLDKHAVKTTANDCRVLFRDLCDHPQYGMGHLTVAQMRKGGVARVKQWAAAHPNWKGSLATVYARVKAAFNYAANSESNDHALDLIESSPIRKLNTGKNRAKHRTRVTVFSCEQYDAILAYANKSTRCPQFGLAFEVLVATGCRPEEFCGVTADDVQQDEHGNMYWLVEHKNQKHTGQRRRVYMLTKRMVEVTRQQMELHPTGPLFRNAWGVPWTRGSLLTQLRRVCASPACAALGLDEATIVNRDEIAAAKKRKETAPKPRREYRYVVYTTRHTFGYRWVNGFYGKELSYQRVADLMGNSAAEVEKTYGHIDKGTPAFVSRLIQ